MEEGWRPFARTGERPERGARSRSFFLQIQPPHHTLLTSPHPPARPSPTSADGDIQPDTTPART